MTHEQSQLTYQNYNQIVGASDKCRLHVHGELAVRESSVLQLCNTS